MKKTSILFALLFTVLNCFADEEPITPPADLQTEKYLLTVVRKDDNTTEYQQAAVGFYGENEVYIQGLSQSSVKGWVKGTLSGTTLTIPECIMGTNEGDYITIVIQFVGATFKYDKDKGTFTAANGYTTKNIGGGGGGENYTSAVLTKIVEKAATPATPSCTLEKVNTLWMLNLNIPLLDTESNPITEDYLSKVIWIKKGGVESKLTFTKAKYKGLSEDMIEIPYAFKDTRYDFSPWTIFLNEGDTEIKSWSRVGVQSIYRFNDEANESAIGWYDLPWADGINNIHADNTPAVIYDLQGRRLTDTQLKRGLYINRGKKILVK